MPTVDRPVRNRKARQKGYEFEVLGMVRCANPDPARTFKHGDSASPAPQPPSASTRTRSKRVKLELVNEDRGEEEKEERPRRRSGRPSRAAAAAAAREQPPSVVAAETSPLFPHLRSATVQARAAAAQSRRSAAPPPPVFVHQTRSAVAPLPSFAAHQTRSAAPQPVASQTRSAAPRPSSTTLQTGSSAAPQLPPARQPAAEAPAKRPGRPPQPPPLAPVTPIEPQFIACEYRPPAATLKPKSKASQPPATTPHSQSIPYEPPARSAAHQTAPRIPFVATQRPILTAPPRTVAPQKPTEGPIRGPGRPPRIPAVYPSLPVAIQPRPAPPQPTAEAPAAAAPAPTERPSRAPPVYQPRPPAAAPQPTVEAHPAVAPAPTRPGRPPRAPPVTPPPAAEKTSAAPMPAKRRRGRLRKVQPDPDEVQEVARPQARNPPAKSARELRAEQREKEKNDREADEEAELQLQKELTDQMPKQAANSRSKAAPPKKPTRAISPELGSNSDSVVSSPLSSASPSVSEEAQDIGEARSLRPNTSGSEASRPKRQLPGHKTSSRNLLQEASQPPQKRQRLVSPSDKAAEKTTDTHEEDFPRRRTKRQLSSITNQPGGDTGLDGPGSEPPQKRKRLDPVIADAVKAREKTRPIRKVQSKEKPQSAPKLVINLPLLAAPEINHKEVPPASNHDQPSTATLINAFIKAIEGKDVSSMAPTNGNSQHKTHANGTSGINGTNGINGSLNGSSSSDLPGHRHSKTIRELLPDPQFKHFGWVSSRDAWNDADENALKQRFSLWAAKSAREGIDNEAELWMWRLLIHFFDAMPHALFRYGLRPECSQVTAMATETADGQMPLQVMEPDFCLELAMLLCHPVWDGDIMKLRAALQAAVCSRFVDHIRPIAGLPKKMVKMATDAARAVIRTTGAYISAQEELEITVKLQYQNYYCGGVNSDKDIEYLTTTLNHRRAMENAQGPASSPRERQMFILRTSDMAAVREALDAQESHGLNKWKPTAEYCRAFAATTAGSMLLGAASSGGAKGGSVDVRPADREILTRWKEEWLLADQRELTIRTRQRRKDPRERQILFDIPQGDEYPLHMFDDSFPDELRQVVNGVVDMFDGGQSGVDI